MDAWCPQLHNLPAGLRPLPGPFRPRGALRARLQPARVPVSALTTTSRIRPTVTQSAIDAHKRSHNSPV
eukprot:7250455-Pyramimonas_sp.AAC.2